jgi:hypothetical protein
MRNSILGTILAACAVLVVLGCFQRVLEIDPAAGFFAATDTGIYVTLIGALLALIGSVGAAVVSLRDIQQPAFGSTTL